MGPVPLVRATGVRGPIAWTLPFHAAGVPTARRRRGLSGACECYRVIAGLTFSHGVGERESS